MRTATLSHEEEMQNDQFIQNAKDLISFVSDLHCDHSKEGLTLYQLYLKIPSKLKINYILHAIYKSSLYLRQQLFN